jgi:hypothetical protein
LLAEKSGIEFWSDIANTTVLKVLDLETDPRSHVKQPEREIRVGGFYQPRLNYCALSP